MKKDYIIPVEWTIVKNVKVSAESLDEAKELAAFASVETGTYLDGSYRINKELLEEFEESRKQKENIESNKEKLLDKTFFGRFPLISTSTLGMGW